MKGERGEVKVFYRFYVGVWEWEVKVFILRRWKNSRRIENLGEIVGILFLYNGKKYGFDYEG